MELVSVFPRHTLFPGAKHDDEDVLRYVLIFQVEIRSHEYPVAPAEVLDAPLLTRDRKLAKSTGHDARIEVI